MKKIILYILISLFILPGMVDARSTRTSPSDIYVPGYYKKNGTYVKGYYKTPPNKSKKDNYSCIDKKRC